jgi:hypothetical protein
MKSPTQSEEDRAADTTFHEGLMHLFGEVPIQRIVDKIRGKLGDEDAEMRILIGRKAFWALCSSQSGKHHERRGQLSTPVSGTARSVLRYLRRCRLQIVSKRSANSEESYFLAICVATARLPNSDCKLSFTGSREIRGRRRWTAHGPFSVAVRT